MIDFDFQKEKFLFTKFFNSPIKRSILGIFLITQKNFITNTNWDPEFYNRLSFTGGKEGKLKRKHLNHLINEARARESLQFLIDFKLLLPLPQPEDLSLPLPNLQELIDDYEEYKIVSGIEFDEDVFSNPSSGLKMSVDAIQHLILTSFSFKISKKRLISAMDELQLITSRTFPDKMLLILEKSNKKMYSMTEVCYQILNDYHPLDLKTDPEKNASIFIELLDISFNINQIDQQTNAISEKSKKLLKKLDPQLVLKSSILLVDKIILRELFINSFDSFFEDMSRIPSFKTVFDTLSNGSELGLQMLKEANTTNNPLPEVFENVDPFEKPVGVVDDFLTAFSRISVAYAISKIVSFGSSATEAIFRPKPGTDFFPNLYSWLESPSNKHLLEVLQDLVTEASFLVDFNSPEEIESIAKRFKE